MRITSTLCLPAKSFLPTSEPPLSENLSAAPKNATFVLRQPETTHQDPIIGQFARTGRMPGADELIEFRKKVMSHVKKLPQIYQD